MRIDALSTSCCSCTCWRPDFADIYMLSRRHAIDGTELVQSIHRVVEHRHVQIVPLAEVLAGYGEIAQQRWAAWRRKQRLEDRLPEQFEDVLTAVIDFADQRSPAPPKTEPGIRSPAPGSAEGR